MSTEREDLDDWCRRLARTSHPINFLLRREMEKVLRDYTDWAISVGYRDGVASVQDATKLLRGKS